MRVGSPSTRKRRAIRSTSGSGRGFGIEASFATDSVTMPPRYHNFLVVQWRTSAGFRADLARETTRIWERSFLLFCVGIRGTSGPRCMDGLYAGVWPRFGSASPQTGLLAGESRGAVPGSASAIQAHILKGQPCSPREVRQYAQCCAQGSRHSQSRSSWRRSRSQRPRASRWLSPRTRVTRRR